MNPVVHERGHDGKWYAYDEKDNTWGPTGRAYNSTNDGYTGTRVSDTRGSPMDWNGGGVVNQDVMLVLAEIQRNKNAFAILAENKRVDIAIVAVVNSNVKTSYKYFTQSLAKYLYYII